MSETDVIIHVETPQYEQTVAIDANVLYGAVRPTIQFFMGGKNDMNTEQGRLNALVRTGVKGVLIMYGDKILDSIFKTKDHPRPEKGDDIVEWYTDMFTKICIASMVKTRAYVTGVHTSEPYLRITKIYTRSDTPQLIEAGTEAELPAS